METPSLACRHALLDEHAVHGVTKRVWVRSDARRFELVTRAATRDIVFMFGVVAAALSLVFLGHLRKEPWDLGRIVGAMVFAVLVGGIGFSALVAGLEMLVSHHCLTLDARALHVQHGPLPRGRAVRIPFDRLVRFEAGFTTHDPGGAASRTELAFVTDDGKSTPLGIELDEGAAGLYLDALDTHLDALRRSRGAGPYRTGSGPAIA